MRKDSAAFTLTILLSHVPEDADGVETLLKTGDNKASQAHHRTMNVMYEGSFLKASNSDMFAFQVIPLRFPAGGRGYAHIIQVRIRRDFEAP